MLTSTSVHVMPNMQPQKGANDDASTDDSYDNDDKDDEEEEPEPVKEVVIPPDEYDVEQAAAFVLTMKNGHLVKFLPNGDVM